MFRCQARLGCKRMHLVRAQGVGDLVARYRLVFAGPDPGRNLVGKTAGFHFFKNRGKAAIRFNHLYQAAQQGALRHRILLLRAERSVTCPTN